MLRSMVILLLHLTIFISSSHAQEMVNPEIKTFGGIYDIVEASVRPTAELDYKIIIDLHSGAKSPDQINPALNNVARMINLHVIGGATAKKMKVVLAIHGDANDVVMNTKSYFERYRVDNPNIQLIKSLKSAGVKLTVCGQSLLSKSVATNQVLEEVEIATSMLTTVTTYQLNGYAFLSF